MGKNMTRRRLIVVAYGLQAKIESWEPLLSRLKEEPDLRVGVAVWLIYHPTSKLLGQKRMRESVRDLMALIQKEWIANGGFEEIILVGHSIGGMIIRGAYVAGRGADPDQQAEHAWALKVLRIVLMACPNRGIEGFKGPLMAMLDWGVKQIPGLFFTYQDLQRGSSFVTNLRVNWIHLFASRSKPETSHGDRSFEEGVFPEVVQLLGIRDTVVHPEDSLDVLAFPNTIAVEVPYADHDNVMELVGTPDALDRY